MVVEDFEEAFTKRLSTPRSSSEVHSELSLRQSGLLRLRDLASVAPLQLSSGLFFSFLLSEARLGEAGTAQDAHGPFEIFAGRLNREIEPFENVARRYV